MTLDAIAQWVGYVVIATGGVMLTAMLIGLAGWQVVEWWWRRSGDLKMLREFVLWKRGRYPG
jgi:hypothetical protein